MMVMVLNAFSVLYLYICVDNPLFRSYASLPRQPLKVAARKKIPLTTHHQRKKVRTKSLRPKPRRRWLIIFPSLKFSRNIIVLNLATPMAELNYFELNQDTDVEMKDAQSAKAETKEVYLYSRFMFM